MVKFASVLRWAALSVAYQNEYVSGFSQTCWSCVEIVMHMPSIYGVPQVKAKFAASFGYTSTEVVMLEFTVVL